MTHLTRAASLALLALASAGIAQDERYTKKALGLPFEFINKPDVGKRTSIKKLLKEDDVDAVVVAFVTSMFGSFEESAPRLQAQFDQYRRRGVVLLISVDPSEGTKPLKAAIEKLGISAPVSLTGVQWTTFQKVAEAKSHNTWPWTFYVDKDGAFVHMAQSQPSERWLEKLARPAKRRDKPVDSAENRPEPADADADKGQPESKTLNEMTVTRPATGGWEFSEGRDEMRLTKALAGDPAPTRLRGGHGIEGLSLLGGYEAFLHVSALDRGAHTNVGSGMVDPGSKTQIIKAVRGVYESQLTAKKVRQLSSSRLGKQGAAELRLMGKAVGLPEYEVSVFVVPLRKFTYIVTVARRADGTPETEKELKAIRDEVLFKRGG